MAVIVGVRFGLLLFVDGGLLSRPGYTRVGRSRRIDRNRPANLEKAIVGLRPSFSSHVRFGERGAPVFPFDGPMTLGYSQSGGRGIPLQRRLADI